MATRGVPRPRAGANVAREWCRATGSARHTLARRNRREAGQLGEPFLVFRIARMHSSNVTEFKEVHARPSIHFTICAFRDRLCPNKVSMVWRGVKAATGKSGWKPMARPSKLPDVE